MKRRHPIVSVLVILLSLYLLGYLWQDFRFFFAARAPSDLGRLPEALTNPDFQPNRYVVVKGAPDRKHAALIEGRVTGYDSFFRLLQSKNLLFVERHRESRTTDTLIPATHRGRLLYLRDLSYAQKIVDHFATAIAREHNFPFDELKQKLAQRSFKTLVDLRGEAVDVTPETLVWIDAVFPHEAVVQFAKTAYATQEEARHRLTQMDLPFVPDTETSQTFWRFVVIAAPDVLKAMAATLNKPEMNAGILPRHLSYSAPLRDLRCEDDTLVIRTKDGTFPTQYQLDAATGQTMTVVTTYPTRIARNALKHVSVSAPFRFPENAMVLISDRKPADHWFYPLLYLLLSIFIVINVIVIRRYFRQNNSTELD